MLQSLTVLLNHLILDEKSYQLKGAQKDTYEPVSFAGHVPLYFKTPRYEIVLYAAKCRPPVKYSVISQKYYFVSLIVMFVYHWLDHLYHLI